MKSGTGPRDSGRPARGFWNGGRKSSAGLRPGRLIGMKETINERKITAAERNDASWNPSGAHESRERQSKFPPKLSFAFVATLTGLPLSVHVQCFFVFFWCCFHQSCKSPLCVVSKPQERTRGRSGNKSWIKVQLVKEAGKSVKWGRERVDNTADASLCFF